MDESKPLRQDKIPPLGAELPVPWGGHIFPIRFTTQEHLALLPPNAAVHALHLQSQDSVQLLFMALVSLANDLYSRQPEGSREFEELVRRLGLKVDAGERGQIPLADFLQKR